MKKFRCEEGHISELDNEFQDCPICGKPVEPVGNNIFQKSTDFIKSNKIPSVIIAALILIIMIIVFWGDDSPESPPKYSIEIINNNDYMEFKIFKNFIDNDGNPTDKSELNFSNYSDYFNFADLMGNRLNFQDGKYYYPCRSGKLIINWTPDPGYELLYPSITQEVLDIDLHGDKPHPMAECPTPLKIVSVMPDNCNIQIETSIDTINGRTALISINGRNGNYLNRNSWAINSSNYRLDIWAIENGVDTSLYPPVAFEQNNSTISLSGCIDCNVLRDKIINAANNYARDPLNLTYGERLYMILPNETQYYLNGNKQSGFNQLDINMRQSVEGNMRCELDESRLNVSQGGNGCIVQVYFTTSGSI